MAKGRGIRVSPLVETAIQSSYAARNRGIWAATGDLLAFTDADCRPQPDWLAKLIQPFQQPQVGIVAGEITALPGHSLLEHYAEYRQMLTQKFAIAHPFYPYGQTANLAVRKVALEKSGLFRPYLTTGGDADLCWRIQMAGDWQIVFVETAIVRHRHRATLADLASQWRRYGRSNQYLHELHGVALGSALPPAEISRRLGRWLAKGLPRSLWQVTWGKAPAVALISEPLDLFCARSRAIGQAQASLPESAREIAWLTGPLSPTDSEKSIT
jgi:GT2 family glycosyltransferase